MTSGSQKVKSDAEGHYRLEGFGLADVAIQATKEGYSGGAARVSIRDMSEREIKQDLMLFRPRRVKLRFAISGAGSDSFTEPETEHGTIDVVVDRPYFDLSRFHYASESFLQFVHDTRLSLRFESGNIRLSNSMAPIFYQEIASGAKFDEIDSIGRVDYNQQHCPPLEQGQILLIHGSHHSRSHGVSQHSVKVLVQEIGIAADGTTQ